MWKEFKAFVLRGNVMDLAVAVIMATAFSAIVNSLVKDIIMPCIGILTSGIDLASLKLVMKEKELDALGEVVTPEVAIGFGLLLNAVIQFLIIALVIFLVIKLITKARALTDAKLIKQKEEAAPAPEIPADVALLTEIRDLLKNKK